MGLNDLNLEFEDEEEKNQDDALEVDGDLSFAAVGDKAPSSTSKDAKSVGSSDITDPGIGVQIDRADSKNIKNIDEARKKSAAGHTKQLRSLAGKSKEGSGEESDAQEEIERLKLLVQKTQVEAQIKVAVAEAKADFSVEFLSNAKLLDHQIGQVLTRMNTKAPQLKSELIMIKKYLADFLNKK